MADLSPLPADLVDRIAAEGHYHRDTVADVLTRATALGWVIIPSHDVPYPGASTTPEFLTGVAERLRRNQHPGGSNVRETVARYLDDIASRLPPPPPAVEQVHLP